MEHFSQIKKNSLLALKNHWGRAICVLLLYFAVWIFLFTAENITAYLLNVSGFRDLLSNAGQLIDTVDLSLTTFLFNGAVFIVHLLIIPPLTLGCLRWFYLLISDKECEVSRIWFYFSSFYRYGKSFLFSFVLVVRSFLWLLLFLLPGIIVSSLSFFLFGTISDQPQLLFSVFGIILSIILLFVGFICWAVYIGKYFLAPYFYFEDETIGLHQAVRLSIQNMKEKKLQYGKFLLSFLGWILLCILILPMFFVLPYIVCSFGIYAKLRIESYKRSEISRKHLKNSTFTMEYKTGDLRPLTQPSDDNQQTLTDLGPLGQHP